MNRVVIDTETCGTLEQPFAYDIGYQIIDKNFQPLVSRRYLVKEVFYGMSDKMETAYYSAKLPSYYQAIADGSLQVLPLADIRRQFVADCKEYKVKQAWAYNASFDRNSLNDTCKQVSNGLLSWFLPYGVEWHCIHALACSSILNRVSYFKFAASNGYISEKGNLVTNAQAAFAFINSDPQFEESHTALQDVVIERQILAYAFTRHVKGKTSTPKRNAWMIPQKQFKEWRKKVKGCPNNGTPQ